MTQPCARVAPRALPPSLLLFETPEAPEVVLNRGHAERVPPQRGPYGSECGRGDLIARVIAETHQTAEKIVDPVSDTLPMSTTGPGNDRV